jgi:hypothetical protein
VEAGNFLPGAFGDPGHKFPGLYDKELDSVLKNDKRSISTLKQREGNNVHLVDFGHPGYKLPGLHKKKVDPVLKKAGEFFFADFEDPVYTFSGLYNKSTYSALQANQLGSDALGSKQNLAVVSY